MPLPIAPSAMTILYLCVFSFGFIGAFLRFTYIIKTFKFDAKTGSCKHYVAYESNRTKQTGMHRFKGSLSTRQINNIQFKKISYQNLLLLITYLLSMLSNLEFQHMSITRHRQREHLNGGGRVGRLLVGCSWRPKDHGYRTACRLASRGTNHRSGDD